MNGHTFWKSNSAIFFFDAHLSGSPVLQEICCSACCSSYLASAMTVRDLLLPAVTVVLGKWLPADTGRVILLHAESLCRKPFFVDGSLCRKQEIADSLGGSQI